MAGGIGICSLSGYLCILCGPLLRCSLPNAGVTLIAVPTTVGTAAVSPLALFLSCPCW